MVNSMLWDSPTPNAEKGSKKFPEEGGGEKHPEETPQVSLLCLFSNFFLALILLVFVTQVFSLDSQYQGNTVEKIDEAPHTEAGPVVGASTSLASSGSALTQEEKLKLAHKLLTVSNRTIRVLVFCLIE